MYESLIAVQMSSGADASCATGARLGAGAAATLSFEVGARSLLDAWASGLAAFWRTAGIWAYMTTGALAPGGFVFWFCRRFAIRIVARPQS